MADAQWSNAGLPVTTDVKEGRPLGRADPLVEVAGVVGGPKTLEVEIQLAGSVRAVHQGVDAAASELGHELLDREYESRGGSDVIKNHQPSSRANSRQDR